MTATASARLHALDAVRALALLAGIVLHAAMSFFLPTPVRDASSSTALAVVFFVIHAFRMSLFFLIAGFFARFLLERHGVRGFVKDRAKRIVVPMVAGWTVLAPAILAILAKGYERTIAKEPSAAAGAAAAPQGFPLMHLWFLYYLALFYAATLLARGIADARLDRDGRLRARVDEALRVLLGSRLLPFVLALPLAAVLYADPGWAVWFGIPTPDRGLKPQAAALAGYGSVFVLGWLVRRQASLLEALARQWRSNLAVAAALTAAALAFVGATPDLEAPTRLAGGAAGRAAYAFGYTVAIGHAVLGLIGAAQSLFTRERPWLRSLADASYWFYLAHVPIVFALQVWMAEWPLHWALKLPLVLAITLALLTASYRGFVRSTVIGEVLNGRKRAGPGAAVRHTRSGAPCAEGGPVASLCGVSKRYGSVRALERLDLAVRPGEVVALLGPNGAGKSTAVGLWLGLLSPDAGEVRLMGGSPDDAARRLGVGVMLQDVALTPTLTAREQVALASSSYADPESTDEVIDKAGIAAFADQRYGRLSGGQKRQAQFAVAICGRPRLLFLDEPTVGLDAPARETLWRTVRTLVSGGCAVVLTTHYLEEAEALADRVAVLAGGRLVAEGTVAEMRAVVARRRIRCASGLQLELVRRWPGVVDAVREHRHLRLTASSAEEVVRRLLDADPGLSELEVERASLAEALSELTREAA